MNFAPWARCAALAVGLGTGLPLPAMSQSDFYAGKTITLFAGFPPGGGVDGEMRMVAQHLQRFIPGAPSIVAKNMPGAGGIALANTLYNNVAPDGLTIGMPGRSGFLLSKIVNTAGVRFDPSKFIYIGAAGSTNSILWLRRELGIESLEQLPGPRELVLGAWSSRSQNAIVPKVLAKYRGWPLKVVHGYRGTAETLLALERGEIDGLYSHEGTIQAGRPDLFEGGKIIPIFQSFDELPKVPVITESATGPRETSLLKLLNSPSQVGLALVAPPGVSNDRVSILRRAYTRMTDDKEYRFEAEKRGIALGQPMTGEELQRLVEQTFAEASAEVVSEYMSYTEEVK
ncbi:MAG: tripartite tricarboxylate transporter substrate-binding protein [Beijerinckiaceae bacterium]|nr:tripartite tricarboxylate transporter substrate-binding protein [Beijerinckiaceae bacterium]